MSGEAEEGAPPPRPGPLFLLLLLGVMLAPCAVAVHARPQQAQYNNHRNISLLLDNLLRGYDNSVRPDFGGPPAEVEVDIMVRSMGPISEVDMTYSMDCYFRQSWVDRRLAFDSEKETLALSISMLQRIWKPDTYFHNGKHSYLHTITTPNKFVRLYRDGRVLYSSRLTIKAGCPMNLEDFPMDTQRCPLKFGSFGYTTSDVLYRWNRQRTVAIAEDMKLSQFDLIATPSTNQTDVLQSAAAPTDSAARPHREFSILFVSFHLQRHMGNFLIQVYGPCVLLVVLSWVSFWLNREATADRVSLGITTVLTMTFLGLEARTDLPKVPYPTALDFFVFLSFAFIFATIIQFAVVHYFTKYGSGECYFSLDFSSDSSSDEDDWAGARCNYRRSSGVGGSGGVGGVGAEAKRRGDTPPVEVIPLRSYRVPRCAAPRRNASWSPSLYGCARPPRGGGDTEDLDGGARGARASTPPPPPPPPPSPPPPPPRPAPTDSPPLLPATATPAALTGVLGAEGGATSLSELLPASLPAPAVAGTTQRRRSRCRRLSRSQRRRKTPRFNSVSKIDRVSRVVFPLCFLVINMFYWYSYLSRSKRILRSDDTF